MLDRMLGAIRLNAHTFEDVENDTGATLQAMTVVILVSLATGLGAAADIRQIIGDEGNILWPLVGGVIFGLLWWAIWALVVMLVGTTILKTPETRANWGQLARGTGFAQAPGLFRIFAFIPWVGEVIVFAATVWQVIALVIAVRQCLDYTSTWRAVGAVGISLVVLIFIFLALIWILTTAFFSFVQFA